MIGRRFAGLSSTCAVMCVVVASVSTPSVAAPSADEHHERGVRAFNAGKYEDAVTEFKAAMAIRPTARTALYMGNAYLELGELQQAKEAFELVLKLEPNHPKRRELESLIRSIDARTEVKVHVESTPPGATIYVDGEAGGARGTTPADLNVTIGKHVVSVAKDGFATESREVVLKVGEPARFDFTLSGKGCEIAMSAKGAADARASVDGAEGVALPAKILVKPGDHKVTFAGPTWQPRTLPLSCDGFTPGPLETSLEPLPGKLELRQPAGTLVKIDGKVVSMSADEAKQGISLSPGRHVVSVTVGDEPERTSVVDVRPGQAIVLGLPNDEISTASFPVRALYFELGGGGNFTLRAWKLGSNSFLAQNGAARLSPTSSGLADVRLGFQATARLAFEMELMGLALPNELDTSKALAWNANAFFHVLPTRWTPIVEIGGGFYQVVSGQLGTDWSARGHLGVGLRGRLGKRLAVRVLVRDVVSKGFTSTGSNNLEAILGVEAFVF